MKVENGDIVHVEYEGKFEDGTVFDTSKNHGKPLEITIGQQQVIPGFEQALIGMSVGQTKEVMITPEEGYGEKRDELIRAMPREHFKDVEPVKAGMMFQMSLQDGQQLPVMIDEVTEKEVTVNMNHPLAGKKLVFDLKLVDIIRSGQ